jgi:hypothetical protein
LSFLVLVLIISILIFFKDFNLCFIVSFHFDLFIVILLRLLQWLSPTGIDHDFPRSNLFLDFCHIVADLKTEEIYESVRGFDLRRL